VALYGGFNSHRPDVNDTLVNPDFRVRYGIVGAEVRLAATTFLYTDARLWHDSLGANGCGRWRWRRSGRTPKTTVCRLPRCSARYRRTPTARGVTADRNKNTYPRDALLEAIVRHVTGR
jgi:hypothetical protein